MSEQALEQRIRATLQRRAADIDVTAPPWNELVERAGGVVVPLRPTDTIAPASHLRRSQRSRLPRVSLRPALATAAALLVAFGAAVVVGGRGGNTPADGGAGDGGTVALDAPASPVIPAPGESDFTLAGATSVPLAPSVAAVADDPQSLAQLYLIDVGLAGSPGTDDDSYELRIDPFRPEIPDTSGSTTGNVWWSVSDRDGVMLADGAVFLRLVDPAAALPTWEVVGAYTAGKMGLNGVRRSGGTLAFTVGDYNVDPTAQVLVDGVEVHAGRVPDGTKAFALEDPAPGQVVTIRLLHVDNGWPTSVTEMAVAPEPDMPVILNEPTTPATPPAGRP